MTALKKVNSHSDAVDYFKELPFYKTYIETIKRLININLLSELPFYDELNIIKTNYAFKGYAMSYKVEIYKAQKKDPIILLETSKSSIKDMFSACRIKEPKKESNQHPKWRSTLFFMVSC